MNTYVDKRIHLCYIYIEMSSFSNKSKLFFCILNSFTALTFGAIIYLFTRNNTYINHIFNFSIDIERNILTDILSFYVADFLWAYALSYALLIFWNEKISSIIVICFGIFWECLQISAIKGTFDFIDIFAYIAASIFAVKIFNLWRTKK